MANSKLRVKILLAAVGLLAFILAYKTFLGGNDELGLQELTPLEREIRLLQVKSSEKKVLRALKDERVEIRAAAVLVVQTYIDRQAAGEYIAPLCKDTSVQVRANAIKALGNLGVLAYPYKDAILGALEDESTEVQNRAIYTLERIWGIKLRYKFTDTMHPEDEKRVIKELKGYWEQRDESQKADYEYALESIEEKK